MIKRTFILGTVAVVVLSGSAAALDTAFSYQGRLSDAGSPANGDYDFQFILYTAEIGGSQVGPVLYGDDVQVIDGFFTVYLDFGAGVFDGASLWLEVRVRDGASTGDYTPLAPRHALLPSPYSLYSGSVEWDDIEGLPPGFADGVDDDTTYAPGNQLALTGDTFDVVEGTGSGLDADTIDGLDSTSLASSAHLHAGEDISSGVVAEGWIDPAVARDNEIIPEILANDGVDSGLDADFLDGMDSDSFATTGHTHSGEQITAGTVAEPRIAPELARDAEILSIVLASDGPGSGLDADYLDGLDASGFAASSHDHFFVGNGLQLRSGELSVVPSDFNSFNPMGVETGGSVTYTHPSDWVTLNSIGFTAPVAGSVMILVSASFNCGGCDIGSTLRMGITTGSVPTDYVLFDAGYGREAVSTFAVFSVSEGTTYTFSAMFDTTSFYSFTIYRSKIGYIFIPS